MFKRSSGILLHPTSLPGKYGIGTLGKEAKKFIDFLVDANQKLWQIFPLGPTGYGDSPYQSFSAFAGNPYLIDFDNLIELELLKEEDFEGISFGDNENYIDYGAIYNQKFPLLEKAFSNFKEGDFSSLSKLFTSFKKENKNWLDDYSLYISIKNHFDGLPWNKWENSIKLREKEAINKYKTLLKDDIEYHKFIQFLFFKQWNEIKKYANDNGIEIIGDIPIFVATDSADAWSNPSIFLFDEELNPLKVAGVPPDYFSKTGQLWGNPLYNWDKIRKSGYRWWIKRIKANFKLCDIIRIDHFRGFESYWAVPFGDKTAENGEWVKGPGIGLFNSIKKQLGDLPIIAEDLGLLTPEVIKLREETNFPGMKILGFAFDSGEDNYYLPHSYTNNCVVYTGTHDNDTLVGWYSKANENDKAFLREYLSLDNDYEIHWKMIKAAWRSIANIAIAPIQDFLGLGSESRINTPGIAEGNWQWRLNENSLNKDLSDRISRITKMYKR